MVMKQTVSASQPDRARYEGRNQNGMLIRGWQVASE
jgi:hypothetical protein